MGQGDLRMSAKERERLVVMHRVQARALTVTEAAEEMGMSERNARRVWARFRREGEAGLVHRGRDRPGNRQADPAVRERAVDLYATQYRDFGPTLAAEKMAERDDFVVNRETLRRWLAAAGLWPGGRRHRTHRHRRPRREYFGELVQIDGSHHRWFEERGEMACLMVMVDDATGRAMAHMAPGETRQAALSVLGQWVRAHGVPQALYLDRNSIYVADREPNARERRAGTGPLTAFGRVCHGLGIRLIAARSPQAKGRVERLNRTLQDRLVKELRLRGISTIDAANAMLPDFLAALNERFAQAPLRLANRHRQLAPGQTLREALAVEVRRVVQNDWTFAHRGESHQILRQPNAPPAKGKILVREYLDGRLGAFWQGRRLRIRRVVDTPSERPVEMCPTLRVAHSPTAPSSSGKHI